MTIDEIKNYIDNITFFITSRRKPFNRAVMKKSLNNIKVMLEALEIEQNITVVNKQLPHKEDETLTTQAFDKWLKENWEWTDKEKMFFPPGMSAEKAMEFLCIYFIDDGSISYPASREQIFTEVVGKLLHKYSDKYKKEQKGNCRGKE